MYFTFMQNELNIVYVFKNIKEAIESIRNIFVIVFVSRRLFRSHQLKQKPERKKMAD